MAVLFVSLNAAHGRNPPDSGFPAGIHLSAKANGEAAIAALGGRLSEVAAYYAKSSQQLRGHFRSDSSLWVNPDGELFFACALGCADCQPAEIPGETPVVESIGSTDPPPFDAAEAFLLHSRPGAKRVIYLDFDGHTDTSGRWKAGAACHPFDLDGNPATFNSTERNRIIYIWQRVAEDFKCMKSM